MSVRDDPASNVFAFRGRQAPASRLRVLAQAGDGNRSDLIHLQPPSNQPIDKQSIGQRIEAQIFAFNSGLIAAGKRPVEGADLDAIRSAAMRSGDFSPDGIMRAVLSQAFTVLPQNDAIAMRRELHAAGVDEQTYFRAAGLLGAGATMLQILDAARRLSAGGTLERSSYPGIGLGSSSAYEAAVRSEGYTGAAAGYLLNPNSVSMTNYMSTPYATTGMTHGTFSHLNNYRLPDGGRFTGLNILHSGQDAVTQRLSPNNRRAATALAALDNYDPNGREFRNTAGRAFQERMRQDEEMRRAAEDYRAANSDEARARAMARMQFRADQIGTELGIPNYVNNLPQQARPFGDTWRREHIDSGIAGLTQDPNLRAETQANAKTLERNLTSFSTEAERVAYQAELRRLAGEDPRKKEIAERLIGQQRDDVTRTEAQRAATVTATTDVATRNTDVAKRDADVAKRDADLATAAATEDAYNDEPAAPAPTGGTRRAEATAVGAATQTASAPPPAGGTQTTAATPPATAGTQTTVATTTTTNNGRQADARTQPSPTAPKPF